MEICELEMPTYFCPFCNSILNPCRVICLDDFDDLLPETYFLERFKISQGLFCSGCNAAFKFDPIPF